MCYLTGTLGRTGTSCHDLAGGPNLFASAALDTLISSTMNVHSPRVHLVGAGPGNPGLLTLRAVECLRQAELVLYDRLVPAGFLEHAPATAERISVEGLPGRHAEKGPIIIRTLLDAARQGKRVVRLKGGDPFLFGRGAEEAEALRAARIPFEVVPGVTAGLAAAAFAGIPLTHRLHASAVALVTGHECPGKPGSTLDWPALTRFPGTLVFYMGLTRLAYIARTLMDHGKAPDTPAAAIRWGTTGEQRTVESPLRDLASAVAAAGLTPPALIVIGPVVALRAGMAWSEQRPLFGQGVLVTRPRHQAADMVRQLEQLGAVVHVLPTVEIHEPADWSGVDQALARLRECQWLVFTSANGVDALIGRLRQTGRDLRVLGHLQLAVIGPGTADALRRYHLEPDLVPRTFNSEGLAEELCEQAKGKRILLARANRGRDLLRQQLNAVANVEQIAVYAQTDVVEGDATVLARLGAGEIGFVTVTSSNIARGLHRLLDGAARKRIQSGEVRLVSISPETSRAIRELGWPVAAEASEYTTAGVIEALVTLV
jgi:uroporphyrinogen III methyltransferase/synthase